MNGRGSGPQVQGPPPSVSTPLLFLALLSVVTVFSALSIFADPDGQALKPLLGGFDLRPLSTLRNRWV
ncbi:hypothetical protein ACI3L1_12050 [Deinococcus sp. SM5_A1]|uniref:hypothetical protein n=1 Tax=Deinococcus sp. SM5_A1 TaxID=3379094 RepID=UPI00385BD485